MYRDVMNAERARTGNYGNEHWSSDEWVWVKHLGTEVLVRKDQLSDFPVTEIPWDEEDEDDE